MENKIILLVGKSGVGKSTVANELTRLYGLKQVQSYTTRPNRYENEKGHIFVNESEFNKLDLVAYTYFNKNHYGATQQQVEENDIYIIDRDGLIYFDKKYKGDKKIIKIMLDIDDDTLTDRMIARGDSEKEVLARIKNDDIMFRDVHKYVDYIVMNGDVQASVDMIWRIWNDTN